MSSRESAEGIAILVVIVAMFFFCGMLLNHLLNERKDCATLCVNSSCVETCPATTRMVRQ